RVAVGGGRGGGGEVGGGLQGAQQGRGRVPRRRGGRRARGVVPPRRQRGGGAMTTGTITPYRSDVRAGRDGFGQLLRAEWTKFRTVRGWVIGMIAAAVVTVLLGLFAASGIGARCNCPACSHAGGPG